MAANTMLPVLLITALKDQFLVYLDVARCSTGKDKKIPHLPNPLTLGTPPHNTHTQQHTLMQTKTNVCYRTYISNEKMLQIQQYSFVGHNMKQTKSLLQTSGI